MTVDAAADIALEYFPETGRAVEDGGIDTYQKCRDAVQARLGS
jgi:hypothetical protein